MADGDGDGLSDRLMQEMEAKRNQNEALAMPDWTDNSPVWYKSTETFIQFLTLASQEKELLTALYRSAKPVEVRAQLLDLRQALQPSPPGRNTRQQVDYLIALSYELEGQSEEAVRRYLELAREHPQTLWSNLAAAKIIEK